MNEFWGISSTAWTGIYALLTFGLLVVAVVAAIYARNQWVEARKAAREASRPYVIVTTEASDVGPQLFDLVVKNIGQRPALNVTVKLDPPPKRVRETKGHEMTKIKMLNEPIAMVAPAQELRTFYDNHVERRETRGVPTVHRVLLTYEDSSGNDYSESSVVDIDALEGTMHTEVKTVHHIGKTLEKMEKTLSSASALQRKGGIHVEASVEPRAEQHRRLAAEEAELQESDQRFMGQLFPGSKAESDVQPDSEK